MQIAEIINNVKHYCNGTLSGKAIDEVTTRDHVLWGSTKPECTGIVTTCFASVEVIRKAHKLGANLIICHEALFWNHGDHTDWLQNNETFQTKHSLLDEYGITVWRCHDYIHSGIPYRGSNEWVDGIFQGLLYKLGWEQYLTTDGKAPVGSCFDLVFSKKQKVSNLAQYIKSTLGLNGIRVIGSINSDVSKVSLIMHIVGEFDKQTINKFNDDKIECALAMELTDFTFNEYIRDSAQLGLNKAIICVGHFNMEEPGMEYTVTWLPRAINENIPISFVPSGDPFNYLI